MSKFLHLSMTAVLALIANISFAQTTIWKEDWSTATKDQTPTEVNANYTFGNGDAKGSTKIYNEKLAGGEAPELLVAKTNGYLTASIDLKGASGDMTLRYKTNRTTVNVTSETEGVTVGDAINNGNSYELTVNVPAGIEKLSLTFTNTGSNARLDDIWLFQGEAKKMAGLSWGTASREVTIGSEENNFPVLSNANNLPVTYTAVPDTAATINATTGEITLVKAGKAAISAIFEGNDEYEAQTVSYTLTVKAAAEEGGGETVDISNTPETAYTVAKAIELIAAGKGLSTKVYVKGTISYIKEISTDYGNATYDISDDGTTSNAITVYRGNYLGGEKFTAGDELEVGDDVVVYGQLKLYNTSNQINTGSSLYSVNNITTGVNGINADKLDTNAPVFNLAGQSVNDNFKGIVVKNGKKFINRK